MPAVTSGAETAVSDAYDQLTYGRRAVGFGRRPGIAVVDLQRGFTDSAFPMGGRPLVASATRHTAQLLQAARARSLPVVTCAMAFKDEGDMPRWKIPAMYEGSFFLGHPAVELDPRIYDPDHDFKVIKCAPSIFFATPAQTYLTRHGVDTVIVCGCMTAGCVRASVVDAFSHGWRVVVPRECVGDVDEAPHEANLLDIQRRYADVLPLAEVLRYLEAL